MGDLANAAFSVRLSCLSAQLRVPLMPDFPIALLNALHRFELTNAKARRAFQRSIPMREPATGETEQTLKDCAALKLSILTSRDPRFPSRLAAIPDPPLLLFVAGNIDALSNDSLAVVGGRAASGAGRRFASRIAAELSEAGLTIVSGLALGVDTAAHPGALKGRSPTIAVLGGGHQQIYPYQNTGLAQAICQQGGAVISEYPPAWRPTKHRFPERNRIVSGLSLGVLVIEARERSGSLITASYALEQGREVMAVPGPVESHLSKGAHSLIRDGAGLVESSDDVLSLLGFEGQPAQSGSAQADLDPKEQQVLEAIDYSETSLDTLVERTGLEVQALLEVLLSLEIAGFVEAHARGYIRAATR